MRCGYALSVATVLFRCTYHTTYTNTSTQQMLQLRDVHARLVVLYELTSRTHLWVSKGASFSRHAMLGMLFCLWNDKGSSLSFPFYTAKGPLRNRPDPTPIATKLTIGDNVLLDLMATRLFR